MRTRSLRAKLGGLLRAVVHVRTWGLLYWVDVKGLPNRPDRNGLQLYRLIRGPSGQLDKPQVGMAVRPEVAGSAFSLSS